MSKFELKLVLWQSVCVNTTWTSTKPPKTSLKCCLGKVEFISAQKKLEKSTSETTAEDFTVKKNQNRDFTGRTYPSTPKSPEPLGRIAFRGRQNQRCSTRLSPSQTQFLPNFSPVEERLIHKLWKSTCSAITSDQFPRSMFSVRKLIDKTECFWTVFQFTVDWVETLIATGRQVSQKIWQDYEAPPYFFI